MEHDHVAAVDQTGGDGRALDKDAIRGSEDLVDNGLLAGELAAPGALANGSPHDIVVAGIPEGRTIALGDLFK
ncbi:MAG TPA: hypothetical protein VIY56_19150 [Vicinamibacterales bacterium]